MHQESYIFLENITFKMGFLESFHLPGHFWYYLFTGLEFSSISFESSLAY